MRVFRVSSIALLAAQLLAAKTLLAQSAPSSNNPIAVPAEPAPKGPSGSNPVVTGGEAPSVAAPGVPGPGGQPAVEAPAPAPGEQPATQDDLQGLRTDLENFKFQWQREIDIHTATSIRSLQISGTIQARFGWQEIEANAPPAYKRHTSFDVPLAVLAFNGSLYKDYENGRNLNYSLRFGASQQQATNNSFANVLDAFLTYSPVPTIAPEYPLLQITLGQQLLPFGIEVPATEELKPVIRNAEFTTRYNLARRDIGLFVRGDVGTRVDYGYNYRQALFAYAVGVVNGSGPNTLDDNDDKDLVGRVAFTLPSDYNSWLRQITIGGTAYLGKQNLYLTDAARTLAGKGTKRRLGLDLYYNHWPFGITAEYIRGRDTSTPGKSLDAPLRTELDSEAMTFTFFFSFGQQFVSGFKNQGKFDDWWPHTWQPFVRFDRFDPNVDTSGDEIEIVTGGLNVFFAETTKFQLNYNRRRDPLLSDIQNEGLAQFQFGF